MLSVNGDQLQAHLIPMCIKAGGGHLGCGPSQSVSALVRTRKILTVDALPRRSVMDAFAGISLNSLCFEALG